MGFRDSFVKVSPPWLADGVAFAIGYACGTVLDALSDAVREGVKARFPRAEYPESLPFIGEAYSIERGPNEGAEHYAGRLRKALDTWKHKGMARVLLESLRSYFVGSAIVPAIRVVADRSLWHRIDPVTGVTTRSKASPANWQWDAHTGSRWWRAWAIVDGTGIWTEWDIGNTHDIGEADLTIGSTMTVGEVAALTSRARKWKPAHVDMMVIVTFSATLFEHSDPPGAPMPDGDFDNPINRTPGACYLNVGT